MTTDDIRPLSAADAVDEWLAQTVVPFGNPSIIEYNVRAFASWLDLQQHAERARHAALVARIAALPVTAHVCSGGINWPDDARWLDRDAVLAAIANEEADRG